MNVVFEFAIGRRLVLTSTAIAGMKGHVQHSASAPEAGGVLMGRHLIETDDVVVDEVTTPQEKDRRKRFSFFRSTQHSDVAMEKWKKSQGKVAYLGLWHTHPEKRPSPSKLDMEDWANAIRKDTFQGDHLFFIIVGIAEIGFWAGNRNLEFKKIGTHA